jgi:murein DD-endopeptidase MepM/ murein hydrolase activator NlpD
MKMSLKNKAKTEIKSKVKKIAFKILKPFIPFIIIIVGIIFAVCTVVDTLFTTEDDMQIAEQLSNNNYETQYAEWLQEKEDSQTVITNGREIITTGMFIWPIPEYTEITSHFGMRTHPITGAYKLHSGIDVSAPIRSKLCGYGRWYSYKSNIFKFIWKYGYDRPSVMALLLYMHMALKY